MDKNNKRIVAMLSLFFTLTATLAPVAASAKNPFGSLGKLATVAITAIASTSGASHDGTVTSTPSDSYHMSKADQNALGGNVMAKKKVSGLQVTPGLTYVVTASAYNAEAAQTDDSPCIAASTLDICKTDLNIIAANIFDANGRNIPFGTAVKIPEVFGDRVFYVHDRLNSRYRNNIDILFEDRSDALKFGRKSVVIEIVSK